MKTRNMNLMGDLWNMTLIVPPDVWKLGVSETGEVCQDIPLHVSCRTCCYVRRYLRMETEGSCRRDCWVCITVNTFYKKEIIKVTTLFMVFSVY
jgi:hypothetical protein